MALALLEGGGVNDSLLDEDVDECYICGDDDIDDIFVVPNRAYLGNSRRTLRETIDLNA